MDHSQTTILINPHGGAGHKAGAVDNLQALLRARLPQAEIEMLQDPAKATERATAARYNGREIIAVAGGDGTINAVAQAVVNSPVRLAVLPFGTFNHFARDLGIPLDLSAAAEVLASGATRRVDVGSINDRFFVNNASLGLYPRLVELREHQRHALAKPVRLLLALLELVRRGNPIPIEIDGGAKLARGPVWLVFVGNNAYDLDIFHTRHRRRLDGGKLDMVVVGAGPRLGLSRLTLQALRARVPEHDLVRAALERLTVKPLNRKRCAVAYDGEVAEMDGPITFRSHPQALSVVAPGTT